MDWDRIEHNWKFFKSNAQRHWGRITGDQLEAIAGKREQLAGRIQQAYGVSKEQAEKQLASWQAAQREKNPFR